MLFAILVTVYFNNCHRGSTLWNKSICSLSIYCYSYFQFLECDTGNMTGYKSQTSQQDLRSNFKENRLYLHFYPGQAVSKGNTTLTDSVFNICATAKLNTLLN